MKADLREHRAQRLPDGTKQRRQFRADVVLRRREPEGEDAAGPELRGRLAEEFQRVKAIDLRRLRFRQVDDDDVERVLGRLRKRRPSMRWTRTRASATVAGHAGAKCFAAKPRMAGSSST